MERRTEARGRTRAVPSLPGHGRMLAMQFPLLPRHRAVSAMLFPPFQDTGECQPCCPLLSHNPRQYQLPCSHSSKDTGHCQPCCPLLLKVNGQWPLLHKCWPLLHKSPGSFGLIVPFSPRTLSPVGCADPSSTWPLGSVCGSVHLSPSPWAASYMCPHTSEGIGQCGSHYPLVSQDTGQCRPSCAFLSQAARQFQLCCPHSSKTGQCQLCCLLLFQDTASCPPCCPLLSQDPGQCQMCCPFLSQDTVHYLLHCHLLS